ncbi:MAG: ADP-ribosylglycohydrolase family protein [candidate division KSB1 bacterium]|nr:ADP-ribosylglycohydrolase family protein [candidate division KSB1 bacterium]
MKIREGVKVKQIDRYLGCLLGLACGDAVGTANEFRPRDTFTPIADMVGGGPYSLEPGQWTDDTSMALCLAESLLVSKGFDPLDQMERYYRWYREGYFSSTGSFFDIGNTVRSALMRYKKTGEPYSGSTDPFTAGNGSIMRLAPVPMFYLSDLKQVAHYSGESSKTTHGTAEAVDACKLFGLMIAHALLGNVKDEILVNEFTPYLGNEELSPLVQYLTMAYYRQKEYDRLKGTGYVILSLQAALWCFDQSSSFSEAVLLAANLGEDADTTAAVCGQIAGAYYGIGDIPQSWLSKLAKRELIENFADRLYHERPVV